jgi:PQQ-dependent catabolism-associated CXXCW motif protein
MRKIPFTASGLLVLGALVSTALAQGFGNEEQDWGVEPLHVLKGAPYSAPTPRRIPGGEVVSTRELERMREGPEGREGPLAPLLIDVASGEGHLTVEGSNWIAGVGRNGHFVDTLQAALSDRLGALTGGEKSRPLVFFCVNSQCWLSYNAALRAMALGYSKVYWYRGGVEAWRAAGLPLVPAAPREGRP